MKGTIKEIREGEFTVEEVVAVLSTPEGDKELTMMQKWPVRKGRPYLKKLPPRNAIPSGIPDESVPLYLQRLEYYRRLYRPKQVEGQ